MSPAANIHKPIGSPYKEISKYVLKVVILSKLKDWNYPYSIANDMKKGCKEWHGKGLLSDVTKSDVYNAISALEKQGYITSKTELKSGRVHRYYKSTKKGQEALKKAQKIREEMIKAFSTLMGDN
jgi:DNA-binding PadR family transcriptional regulator